MATLIGVHLLLLAKVLAVSLGQPVTRLDKEVDEELALVDQEFRESLQKIFYDKLRQGRNSTVFALSAEMANIEIVMHAIEHGTLLATKDIVRRYFIDESVSLRAVLVPDTILVDIILQRSIMRAIADAFLGTETSLKRLFLLLKRNRHVEGVKELALDFFEQLEGRKDRADIAEYELEAALAIYTNNGVDSVNAHLFGRGVDDQVTATLQAVDELIDEAMNCLHCAELNEPIEEMKGMHSMFRDGHNDLAILVDQQVDRIVVSDIRTALAETTAQLARLDLDEIESVDPEAILEYEEELFGYRAEFM